MPALPAGRHEAISLFLANPVDGLNPDEFFGAGRGKGAIRFTIDAR